MKTEIHLADQRDAADDALKRNRLRTMQRIAVGLLVAATALFAFARARHGQHPAWGYVEAFAEAAMVGAVADWFAVVALFRHPLGIPVWHTAIIPNSKDSIATSLGKFVENHFITEDSIIERVRQADIGRQLGEWLLHPVHAQQVGTAVASLARQLLQQSDGEQIRQLIRELATSELIKLDLSAVASGGLNAMLADGKQQALLDMVLDKLGLWLADDANHDVVANFLISSLGVENGFIRTAMQGYMPKAISSLQEQIVQVRQDPVHPMRARLGDWIADGAMQLTADPAWRGAMARYQAQAVQSDSVQQALGELWDAFRSRIATDLTGPAPVLATMLQGVVEQAGRVLVTEPGARAWLNDAIESVSRTLVQRHRGAVTPFIEQQLARWTQAEMSDRIELAIGRDLQFIRINGTIVGGLAGLLIYAVTTAF